MQYQRNLRYELRLNTIHGETTNRQILASLGPRKSRWVFKERRQKKVFKNLYCSRFMQMLRHH